MNKDKMRIWHVTVNWTTRNKRLKKEFIISAETKDKAIACAKNRIASPADTQPVYRARDLGALQINKTYYSSDVLSGGLQAIETQEQNLLMDFTIAWGSEIGWRATNQSATQTDQLYLAKLRDTRQQRQLLPQWVQEYITSGRDDPTAFFNEKLSEYLGTQVTSTEDMIPVSDTDYDRLMKKARGEAEQIIQEARNSAADIRQQLATEAANLADIAKALIGGNSSAAAVGNLNTSLQSMQSDLSPAQGGQSYEPDQPDKPPVETDDLTEQEPIPEAAAEEAPPDDTSSDLPEPSDQEPETDSSQEPENPPEPDDTQSTETQEEPVVLSDEELMSAFPDDEPSDEEEFDEDIEVPEEDLPPDDFEFGVDTLEGTPSEATDETRQEEGRLPAAVPEDSSLTDEILAKALIGFKADQMEPFLKKLKLKATRASTGTQKEISADKALQQLFNAKHIPQDQRSTAIAQIVMACQPIGQKSAVRYLYDCCTINAEDDDTIIE